MTDPRLQKLRDAVLAMQRGQFRVSIEPGLTDDLGQLESALSGLGYTLEGQFEEMRALARITEKINSGLLLEEILDHVYRSFQSILPYDRIGFSLIEKEGSVLRAVWERSEFPIVRLGRDYCAPLQGSGLQEILRTGQPRIINDLVAYLQEHPQSESTRLIVEEGVRSSLTCPLVAAGKPVGFIFFSSRLPGTYQDAHVDLYMEIAGQLAMIIEKGRLYQQILDLSNLKDRFLGMVAHDLRNPIGVIQGYASLLCEEAADALSPDARAMLGNIEKSCGVMLDLIEDLLDVNIIESGHLRIEPCEVAVLPFVEELRRAHEMAARKKSIRIETFVEEGPPTARFDPARMPQVLGNLVTNALKFSHPGTCVTLRARCAEEGVEFTVTDQGQGIPDSEAEMLFQDFRHTSVKPTAGERSTGLGLAIVKWVVDAHGGFVKLESVVGKGSTFTVSIPRAGLTRVPGDPRSPA